MDVRTASLLFCIALALPRPALADEGPARADALFEAAKRLLEAGSVAEACRALSESYALDPTGGTLLNLGVCLEKQGKLASAVNTLEQALRRAEEDQRADRAEVARNHLEAVRPRLSFLVLARAKSLGTAPLEVHIDGEAWSEDRWQTPRPLDPGEHEISYGAPGAPKRVEKVAIGVEGETHTLMLEPAPPEPKPKPKPKPKFLPKPAEREPSGAPGWLLPTGISASAAGAIGLAVGIGFGVEALNIDAKVRERCPEVACDDQATVDLNDDFDRAATASTASFVAGGILAAAGLSGVIAAGVLDRDAKSPTVALRATPSFVSLEARW